MKSAEGPLYSLAQLDGVVGPHDALVKRGLAARVKKLEGVRDPAAMAAFIGAVLEGVGGGETWAVKKEVFPGVNVHLVFDRGDEEFPSRLRALYSGKFIRRVPSEDMVEATILCANHLTRYAEQQEAAK
jgi:hypothetical protein